MEEQSSVSRRQYIGGTLAATAAGTLLGALSSYAEETPAPVEPKRQIKLGGVGVGGRGYWLAGLHVYLAKPVAASGWGAQFRSSPHGDALDTTCVMYAFDDGTVWNHQSPRYWGKAFVRGGQHSAARWRPDGQN